MKRLKKILLLAVAMLLAAVISITATIAYLMHQTDMEKNAFSVGKVKISLDEAKVDKYGRLLDVDGGLWTAESGKDKAPRVTENSYELSPGKTYVKDPTVHVSEDSEPCWIIVKLEIPSALAAITNTLQGTGEDRKHDNVFVQLEKKGWILVANDCYYYKQTVQPGEDVTIFETLTARSNAYQSQWDAVMQNDMEIKITAFAVQEYGIDDGDAAFEAIKAAYPEYFN
jgi:hypothetical protein